MLSDLLPLVSGFPQWSVFGSLLFNMYIDDLLQSLPDDSYLAYSDDMTLIASGKTRDGVTRQLQAFLDLVSEWELHKRLAFSTRRVTPSTSK